MINKDLRESYIRIYVCDLAVDVRIGLHPWEQKPQRLIVNAELYAEPISYLKGTSIIDYDRVRSRVLEWQGRAHVKLIETYVRELLEVAFEFDSVSAARVSVTKVAIFPEAKGAGVEAYMTRDDYKKL